MKIIATAILFAFTTLLVAHAALPATPEELRRDFEAALTSKDTNAIASLIYWKGVPDKDKAGDLNVAAMIAQHKVITVMLAPWPTNYPTQFEGKGVRYKQNLDILGMLEIHLADRNGAVGAQFPYGKVDGHYLMAATVSEPVTSPAK